MGIEKDKIPILYVINVAQRFSALSVGQKLNVHTVGRGKSIVFWKTWLIADKTRLANSANLFLEPPIRRQLDIIQRHNKIDAC